MERNKPSAIAKVPQEWVEQLEEIAKQTGKPINELVRDAIAQYLEVDKPRSPNSPLEREVEQLRTELATCKTQITQMSQKIDDFSTYSQIITTLQIRLTSLEGKIIQNHPSKAIATTSSKLINIDEDDYDDEPDEILPDFLPRS